ATTLSQSRGRSGITQPKGPTRTQRRTPARRSRTIREWIGCQKRWMAQSVDQRRLGGPHICKRVLTGDPDGRARTNDRPALTTGPTGRRRPRHPVLALPETRWIGVLAVVRTDHRVRSAKSSPGPAAPPALPRLQVKYRTPGKS